MNRAKFSSEQIADIVMKIIGEIEPIGKSEIDNARFDNLLCLENTLDILLDEIRFIKEKKPNYEYSVKKVQWQADLWLEEKKLWLEEMYDL